MNWEPVVALAKAADRHDERRVLVLAGTDGHEDAAKAALETGAGPTETSLTLSTTTVVGRSTGIPCEHLPAQDADQLLGTTRSAVVLDCRDSCEPNDIGRVVGAVDGGGLLVLLTPPLDQWPDTMDGFDRSLAIPPDPIEAVSAHFRDRLVETLRVHPGIAIVDLDEGRFVRDGLTDRGPSRPASPITRPETVEPIPDAVFEACLTQDQADAVARLAALQSGPVAAVLEADRGRGKSSVAGLVAAWRAARGETVLVTGPNRRATRALFDRVEALLPVLDGDIVSESEPRPRIEGTTGGMVEFVDSSFERSDLAAADLLIVEEAAALPVAVLESTLAIDRVAYTTTVHGYEGSGRGFAVRFRDRLAAARHQILDVSLEEPIRYAGGDPVEVWAARALLLNAGPVPGAVIEGATPDSVSYRALSGSTLRGDEQLLREVFGLLVAAHYRTEPNDLARMLDGSNLAVRVLLEGGHVVSVALIAREGGLPKPTRERAYAGDRVRGNMLPDVLMSQLRDPDAGRAVGIRIARIGTHHAVRSRGLGTALLAGIEAEFDSAVDWVGTGFGVTPPLVSFWRDSGYRTVHLSTTRNERSGEHSVLMLKPTSTRGTDLVSRHGRWFGERIGGVIADSLSSVDPTVIRVTLAAAAHPPPLRLSSRQWEVVAGAAYGPGLYSVDPAPFRRLAVHTLIDEAVDLSDREAALLIRGLLQHQPWSDVADALGYDSRTAAMRAFGRVLQPLVREYGPPPAQAVRRQFDG